MADSPHLRQFLRIGLYERTPDRVTISRTRRLIGAEAVGAWRIDERRNNRDRFDQIGSNAAMKSIVRRDTPQGYDENLKQLTQAEGIEEKRPKRIRNEEWVNLVYVEAEITRLKDGRTALVYKAEQRWIWRRERS